MNVPIYIEAPEMVVSQAWDSEWSESPEAKGLQNYKPTFTNPLAEVSQRPSLFLGKSANQTIAEARLRPMPRPLWNQLWFEHEVGCLFSDANLGKSILAVQIANEISKTEPVALFDFELSDKQFQIRYSTGDGQHVHQFSPNLMRYEINPESIAIGNFEEAILKGIEQVITDTGTKVLIIDNLTYLCIASEKGDLAGQLMIHLMGLKRKYGLSILVLAHTPKRLLTNPISQNDLAGSKKLFNFFDSVFAIGQSCKDNELRYIKQIKCRNASFTLDSDNVALYQIEKVDDCFLSFTFVDFAVERDHLKEVTTKESDELIEVVLQDHAAGKSFRKIADEQRISTSKVQRILKKAKG